MSDFELFSPISDVPISGSVRYRWSRISEWVPTYDSYTMAGQADCFCGASAGEQPAQEEERSAPGDPGRDHSVEIYRFSAFREISASIALCWSKINYPKSLEQQEGIFSWYLQIVTIWYLLTELTQPWLLANSYNMVPAYWAYSALAAIFLCPDQSDNWIRISYLMTLFRVRIRSCPNNFAGSGSETWSVGPDPVCYSTNFGISNYFLGTPYSDVTKYYASINKSDVAERNFVQ